MISLKCSVHSHIQLSTSLYILVSDENTGSILKEKDKKTCKRRRCDSEAGKPL